MKIRRMSFPLPSPLPPLRRSTPPSPDTAPPGTHCPSAREGELSLADDEQLIAAVGTSICPPSTGGRSSLAAATGPHSPDWARSHSRRAWCPFLLDLLDILSPPSPRQAMGAGPVAWLQLRRRLDSLALGRHGRLCQRVSLHSPRRFRATLSSPARLIVGREFPLPFPFLCPLSSPPLHSHFLISSPGSSSRFLIHDGFRN